jgi:hypothetical protein
MRLLSASAALLFVALLSGCASTSSPLAPDSAAVSPSSTSASPASERVYGAWTYTAERGRQVMRGEIFLSSNPAEHRLTAPGLVSDVVSNSQLAMSDSTMTWRGYVQTPVGPTGFRMNAAQTGETFSGTVDIEGIGTYTLVATRKP